MASSSAEWTIGWIISDLTEYQYTVPLLGSDCVQSSKLGQEDDLNWAMGEIYGKKVLLVHAPKEWHAYAGAIMKQRFSTKVLFIGGTYESTTDSFPPIGHCLLKLPEIDERRYDRLAASIPGDDVASLAKLVNGMDRFVAGAKQGQFNLDQVIYQWVAENAELGYGLTMPDAETMYIPATYPEWPKTMNYHMCCGKEFNSGSFTNQTPCLKVMGVRGYRGRADNSPIWHKYATLASAAAISCIIYNIAA